MNGRTSETEPCTQEKEAERGLQCSQHATAANIGVGTENTSRGVLRKAQ